jgi:cobalt/nickel transport system permease protein
VIDILALDRWSSQGTSWLHRASAAAKLGAVLICIGFLIVSQDPLSLALVCAALGAALISTRLPVVPLLGLAVAPVTMSALFALTRLGGTWESAVVIIEKGFITSMALLLLVATTPQTDLFRVLRRVLPRALADMLLLAYRAVFILLRRALEARAAVRLRSGALPWPQRLRRNALIGGLVLLQGTELAEAQYAAMRLRGYPGPAPAWALHLRPAVDIPLLLGVAAMVSLALSGTLEPPVLGALMAGLFALGLWARSRP